MARNFVQRFNYRYGNVFPEPVAYNFNEKLVKIPALDGTGKMGKSEGNGIFLIDDEKEYVQKQIKDDKTIVSINQLVRFVHIVNIKDEKDKNKNKKTKDKKTKRQKDEKTKRQKDKKGKRQKDKKTKRQKDKKTKRQKDKKTKRQKDNGKMGQKDKYSTKSATMRYVVQV